MRIIVALCALATVHGAQAGARVIDIDGTAWRDRDPLALFQAIATRDVISVPANASITLVLDREGRQFVLTGPGRWRVEDDGPATLEGAPPRALGPTPSALRVSIAPGSRRVVTGATTMRAAQVADLAPLPDATRLITAPDALTWADAGPGSRYRVRVGTAAGESLHEATVESNRYALPADTAMRGGGSYAWSVDVETGPRRGTRAFAAFTVSDGATRDSWAALAPPADAPVSQWVLYANALEDAGYFVDAGEAWKRVTAARPALRTGARTTGER